MGIKRYRLIKYAFLLIFSFFMLFLAPTEVRASQEQQDNEIYESLDEKIKNNFYEGLESVEDQAKSIEISGNILERVIRSIANGLYKNLEEIKAGCLLAGVISFLGGFIVFKTVKLNVYAKNFKVTTKLIELLSELSKIQGQYTNFCCAFHASKTQE